MMAAPYTSTLSRVRFLSALEPDLTPFTPVQPQRGRSH